MTVVLIGNAKAGRGRARRLFIEFRAQLESAGFRVVPLALGEPGFADIDRFEPERFRGAQAIVAFGGDGTANAVAGPAVKTSTPVYHVPTGNENLFARAFGMTRNPTTLVNALRTRHVQWTDTGLCNDRTFLIMVSAGPDAGIIKRLHAARTKALGHLAYAEPMLRESRRPTLPRVHVTVDGKPFVDHRRGWLIVANNPQYAARINPASKADPTSGLLEIIFMPAENLRDCLNWLARAWTRQHRRDPRLSSTTGRSVGVVTTDTPLVYQLDGEYPDAHPGSRAVTIQIQPRQLPILCT